jgi:hypothetical protein
MALSKRGHGYASSMRLEKFVTYPEIRPGHTDSQSRYNDVSGIDY